MAIEKVKIKDMIPTLDTEVSENDSSFSAGQKQLICLARAALRKCKIVVMDEATANMDDETDKMLHNVIEEIFCDCTVITIAHRLRTIINCDMVLVMDNGELIEVDNPKELMKHKNSTFYKMCQESKLDWEYINIYLELCDLILLMKGTDFLKTFYGFWKEVIHD